MNHQRKYHDWVCFCGVHIHTHTDTSTHSLSSRTQKTHKTHDINRYTHAFEITKMHILLAVTLWKRFVDVTRGYLALKLKLVWNSLAFACKDACQSRSYRDSASHFATWMHVCDHDVALVSVESCQFSFEGRLEVYVWDSALLRMHGHALLRQVFAYMYVYEYVFDVCMYVCTCMYVCVCVFMYVCMYVCTSPSKLCLCDDNACMDWHCTC